MLYRRAMNAGDRTYAPNNLGALIVSREPDEARKLFEQATDAGETVYAACNLAHTYLATDTDRSIALYEQSLSDGNETEAKLGLAYLIRDSQQQRASELKEQALAASNIWKSFAFLIKVVAAYDYETALRITRYFMSNGYPKAWEALVMLVFAYDYDPETGVILFGTDPETKARIPWLALKPVNDGVLLLSKYVIRKMPFAKKNAETNWAESEVKKWLNGVFVTEYLNAKEEALLKTHPRLSDRAFCITEAELDECIADGAKKAIKTASDFRTHRRTKWWLRSVEECAPNAPCLDELGNCYRVSVFLEQGVRPAIICKIEGL